MELAYRLDVNEYRGRRSLQLMAFMPLPTMIIAVIAGVMAAAYIPGLEGAASDQIFGRVLRDIQTHSTLGYGLVVVLCWLQVA